METRWHYIGWEKPLPLVLAEGLRQRRREGISLDRCLLWVPSARAGRHVLNELFSGDAEGVEAFHPPRMVTPAQYVRSLLDTVDAVASEAQSLHAWKAVLFQAETEKLAELFPVIPREDKTAWAYSMAEQLMRVRERLAEDQLDFGKVSARNLPGDVERWATLAWLEAQYLDRLGMRGLRDPAEVMETLLQKPIVEEPYTEILVAGILNLSRRQAACLEALSGEGRPINFIVPAPESRAGDFDDLGRPKTGCWETEALDEALLEGRIQRAPEPRELVDHILDLSTGYQHEVDALVVGSPEPENSRYLIERSQLTPTPYYAPEGKALAETEWGRLIYLHIDWHRGAQLSTLFDLFGHARFRQWARQAGLSATRIQSAILHLRRDHLFRNLSDLEDPGLRPMTAIAEIRKGLQVMEEQLSPEPPEKTGFAEWVWHFLQSVAVASKLDTESRHLLNVLEELLEDIESDFSELGLTTSDSWELVRHLLESTQIYPERGADERPVSGWLELPWETAPHLVVLGLPDKQVPGPKSLDSFLTPVLCRHLGLYGPEALAAFHAFRLRLILESRREWGRVDIVLPDRALDDEPSLHSRFLYLAGEDQILDRVNLLLGESHHEEVPLPADFGTRLTLPEAPKLEKLSVTAFSAYLRQPLQFYLQNRLYWSAPEDFPQELDALKYGTIVHGVLERLNASEAGRALKETKAIAEFLQQELEAAAEREFGSRLSVPLQIQMDSMRERLEVAARVISEQREAGWVPEYAEWGFNANSETRLEIGGVPVSGKIDLIERNTNSGEYRIVDYKTSDSASRAESSHLGGVRSNSGEPPLAACDFEHGGKLLRWKDLQLPLYQLAAERLLGVRPTCAYFNLSKSVSEIGLNEWKPDADISAAALACAEAIIQQIQDGIFPVDVTSRYTDPWLDWFGGDYRSAIEAAWLRKHGGVES